MGEKKKKLKKNLKLIFSLLLLGNGGADLDLLVDGWRRK